MEVKFLNQPKEIKLGDVLKQRLKENFKGVYLIAGMLKDTGIDEMYEELQQARKEEKEVNLFIGIDRKNTSKDMLLKLISIGCNLSVHINTDESKVETRAYIFENPNDTSYIYVTGAKFSAGGLYENDVLITEIKYLKDEIKSFEVAKNSILQGVLTSFYKIDKDEVILLAEKGEIVARIIDRKIPKISEMYGMSEQVIGEQVYDESTSTSKIMFDELAEVNIDFDPIIAVRKNVELETEKEAKKEKKEREEMLQGLKKTESDLDKLYGKTSNEKLEKKKATIHMSDEINYKNMTTLIIESNKIIEKGAGAGEFKIPKALSENMTDFFDSDDVVFEIIDNKENVQKEDANVKLIWTDKGISIKSQGIIDLKLNENDIVRLIKEGEKKYRCEIIRKDTEEYKIWSCYLVNSIKGNKRKFGVI